ncbi:hypothetical protein K0M31_015278 [Melipona bicolor]|uniref:Uncharacterized protein n=1 Tax=Melipona bicolor TaxID=60889 RepID=A0AA40KFA9_9HYME|nr:hypothetical protein K0M31_015278 [Melipona bicolor]
MASIKRTPVVDGVCLFLYEENNFRYCTVKLGQRKNRAQRGVVTFLLIASGGGGGGSSDDISLRFSSMTSAKDSCGSAHPSGR